jgi:pimeloyl-ACP methyl ester carboxylesterase
MKKFLLICLFTFLGFQSKAEERYITTSDGVELYVSIKGSGEPCLYLHGGPGSGSYWVEKFFGEQLEKQFTMIYLDQRGVGRSSSPQDQNYSLERMALDFEEVRNAYTVPLMDRMQSHIYELKQKDIFWKMGFETKEAEALLDATYTEIPNWNFNYGNAAFSYEDYWKDFKPVTAGVSVPVLFYYGTKDWMVGPQHYKGMQFQNMLLWDNEGGHIPFIENKEDLEKAISTFRKEYNF